MTFLSDVLGEDRLSLKSIHEPLFYMLRLLHRLDRFSSQSSFTLHQWRRLSFKLGSASWSGAFHISNMALC